MRTIKPISEKLTNSWVKTFLRFFEKNLKKSLRLECESGAVKSRI